MKKQLLLISLLALIAVPAASDPQATELRKRVGVVCRIDDERIGLSYEGAARQELEKAVSDALIPKLRARFGFLAFGDQDDAANTLLVRVASQPLVERGDVEFFVSVSGGDVENGPSEESAYLFEEIDAIRTVKPMSDFAARLAEVLDARLGDKSPDFVKNCLGRIKLGTGGFHLPGKPLFALPFGSQDLSLDELGCSFVARVQLGDVLTDLALDAAGPVSASPNIPEAFHRKTLTVAANENNAFLLQQLRDEGVAATVANVRIARYRAHVPPPQPIDPNGFVAGGQ